MMRTFDLEAAIGDWKSTLASKGIDKETLLELESHLRDFIADLRGQNISDESAFLRASKELSRDLAILQKELVDTRPSKALESATRIFHFNDLKIALRSIMKRPVTNLFNIAGLALGVIVFLLIMAFISTELSYDREFTHADRLYRLEFRIKNQGVVRPYSTSSPPIGPAISANLPEVASYVRLRHGDQGDPQLIENGDKRYYENRIFYADSTFFDLFDYPVIAGDAEQALNDPKSIVLTQQAALKYFGSSNVIGRTLLVDGNREFKVSLVLSDKLPSSHLDFDFLLPMTAYQPPSFGSLENWSWFTFYNYILLEPNANLDALETKIPQFLETHWREGISERVSLAVKPLTDIYLYSEENADKIGNSSSPVYIQVLSLFGSLLFVISILNYLALFRTLMRSRVDEFLVRKTFGANPQQIFKRVLNEAVMQGILTGTLAAMGIGFLYSFNPALLNNLLGSNGFPLLLFAFLIPVVIATLASFIIPTRSKSRKYANGELANEFRNKMIVAGQFGFTTLLIILSVMMTNQLHFISGRHLGFERENILVVSMLGEEAMQNFNSFKSEIIRTGNALQVGSARLGLEGRHGSYNLIPLGTSEEESYRMAIYPVGNEFLETLQIKIISGNTFQERPATDTTFQYIINQSAAKLLNWEEPVGRKVMLNGQGGMYGEIVGVVEDFNYRDLSYKLEPMVLFYRASATQFAYVRMPAGDHRATIENLSEIWNRTNPASPFVYEYLDTRLAGNYSQHKQVLHISDYLMYIALALSAIGLFGLTTHLTQLKSKEISIRRVMGSSVFAAYKLQVKQYLLLVTAGFLVATPLALFFVENWLDGFYYRIELSAIPVLVTFTGLCFVTLLVVSYGTLTTALKNPATVLRNKA